MVYTDRMTSQKPHTERRIGTQKIPHFLPENEIKYASFFDASIFDHIVQSENGKQSGNEKPFLRLLWLEWRFRVIIGNNGAVHFSAYPEPSKHTHSLLVYFSHNLAAHAVNWHSSTRYLHYFFLTTTTYSSNVRETKLKQLCRLTNVDIM